MMIVQVQDKHSLFRLILFWKFSGILLKLN